MLILTLLSWFTQRISSLGLVALFCLLYLALWHNRNHDKGSLCMSQKILVGYTLLVHLMGLAFPLRLCYATWTTGRSLKGAMFKRTPRKTSGGLNYRSKDELKLSSSSDIGLDDSSFESSSSSSSSDIAGADTPPFTDHSTLDAMLVHTIVIPNYKEDIDTLKETLEVLACHPQARLTYEICLAMEHGEVGSNVKAAILVTEFESYFRAVYYTSHPRGIDREAQGKSSNLCWAAKYLSLRYKDEAMKQDVIVTVIDADSHLSTKYFESINTMHLAHSETAATTIYVPPIIFDRNSHLVPTLIRVADLLWTGAGLSGHYTTSSICPPTSVYSLSLALIERVGGWDAGDDAIGEDLHMYLKCYFALDGHLTTRTIMSAASQTNVNGSGPGIRGLFLGLRARYQQAFRHMWGALDSGYVVNSTAEMCWRDFKGRCDNRPNYARTVALFHRLFEAHFLPNHITIILLSVTLYTSMVPKNQIPLILQQAITITDFIRILSLAAFISFFFLYESYHSTCVRSRKAEMIAANLEGRMEGSFTYRKDWRRNVIDYALFPIAGMIYGTVPAVAAQVCHFWTLSLVYRVSQKPERREV